MNVTDLLTEGGKRLAHASAGRLEAEILLCHVLRVNRAWLYANGERAAPAEAVARYRRLIDRRGAGEPIAYLVGTREFWSLDLNVTPDVLIPRPETELLVEIALAFIPVEARWRIADIGTGSGAVALAIAAERRQCEIHATDSSKAALALAIENGERLLPGRVTFHAGSWLQPLKGRFRVIVSNPPYIAEGDRHLDSGDCRFEPRQALTPGADGLAAIRAITSQAPAYLEAGGMLALEHGFDQAHKVRGLLKTAGFVDRVTHQDLQGLDRVTSGYLRQE